MPTRKSIYVVLSVLLCAIGMSLVDGVLQPPYIIKSVIKLVLFLVIPTGYFFLNKQEIVNAKKLFIPAKKDLIKSLLLGVGVFGVILGAYFLLGGWIDFSGIAKQLTASAGVSAENFLFVSLYISFINSFLEEFFFRGFAFITLKKLTGRTFAYLFSAMLFAAYHLGMTAGWFSMGIWLLAFLGLFVGGCVFNYLNEKTENIYSSWLVHAFANFAINVIGFSIFGLV